jgi:hypothetical protein
MGESGHLGQVVLVPKTGLRGDCDFVKSVSKAGRGNDRAWKAGKAKKTAFHPSPRLGNPFGITRFPRPRLLSYFNVQEHVRPNPKPIDLKAGCNGGPWSKV